MIPELNATDYRSQKTTLLSKALVLAEEASKEENIVVEPTEE